MCGRFVSTASPEQVAEHFGARAPAQALESSFNVAPTNDVYTVLVDGGVRQVVASHWGLVPFWAKDPKIGSRMINARAETLAEKNSFKSSFRKRRCLIPAAGFYEWVRVQGQKAKQPLYLHRPDDGLVAFAGLWSTWHPKDDEHDELRSCTIITCEPNETIAQIHNRMPVILAPDTWELWLDPDVDDTDRLAALLGPAPKDLLEIHKVSTEVNNVRNKGADLILPIGEDPRSC